jgi:hypothetical protein
MKVRQLCAFVIIGGLTLCGLALFGPVAAPVLAGSEGLTAAGVKRIGVVPFFKGRYGSTISETLTCPVCQLSLDPEAVDPIADRVLTDYVHEALFRRNGEKVIPSGEMRKAYEEISLDEAKDSPLSIAQKCGKALDAQAVVLGTVWKYRERDPESDRAASVAFALFMIDIATGKPVWKASFSETQKSLSENILEIRSFLKKGGRWLSAGDLARYGVREVFRKFPF